MAHIYLYVSGETRGPYSESDIRGMLAAATITPETPYWKEGATAWHPLGQIENLAGKFRDPATSIVPPRRPQSNGRSKGNLEPAPLTPREKGLEIKKRSVRNPQITPGTAVLMGLLFFFILGAMLYLAALIFPDIQTQWEAQVGTHR